MHILLVDDDAELCGLLGEFLTREGFTVECAHDGARGLERALQPGVDLVLQCYKISSLDFRRHAWMYRHYWVSWPLARAPRNANLAVSCARESRVRVEFRDFVTL